MLRPQHSPGGSSGLSSEIENSATRDINMVFQYNGRVAAALVPAGLVVLGAGGTPAFTCTAVGLLLAYTLDVMRMGEATLAVLWLTLLADYFCLAFGGGIFEARRPWPMSLMLSFVCGQTLFLLGSWVSLQARMPHRISSVIYSILMSDRLTAA